MPIPVLTRPASQTYTGEALRTPGVAALLRMRATPAPPAREPGPALFLPQVFDGDVAPFECRLNVPEVPMKAIELEALTMEDVSGPGAAEEGEEAMKEHSRV